jgi:hypothetical protein
MLTSITVFLLYRMHSYRENLGNVGSNVFRYVAQFICGGVTLSLISVTFFNILVFGRVTFVECIE